MQFCDGTIIFKKNFTFISLLYLPCVVEARVKVLGVSLEVFPITMTKVECCGGIFVEILLIVPKLI